VTCSRLGYHQVKLFSYLNLSTGGPGENLVNFGFNHDYNFGEKMSSFLPANGVEVMDRGFAGLSFLQSASKSSKYFVLRIGNKYKLEFDEESKLMRLGTGKEQGLYRVVSFCDLETKREYWWVTNSPFA